MNPAESFLYYCPGRSSHEKDFFGQARRFTREMLVLVLLALLVRIAETSLQLVLNVTG